MNSFTKILTNLEILHSELPKDFRASLRGEIESLRKAHRLIEDSRQRLNDTCCAATVLLQILDAADIQIRSNDLHCLLLPMKNDIYHASYILDDALG